MKRRPLIVINTIQNFFRFNRPRVALVSCDEWKNRVVDDVLLQNAFIAAGFRTKIISWQNPRINYTKFQYIIITSMWGYQNHLPEFEKWLAKVEQSGAKIVNPLDVIKTNYDKLAQLQILDRHQIPHIKTAIVPQNSSTLEHDLSQLSRKFGRQGFVIKPSISGSGQNTFLISDDVTRKNTKNLTQIMPKLTRINQTRALLAQPFIAAVDQGETSVIFIDGQPSHAVLRFPQIFNRASGLRTLDLKNLTPDLLALCDRIKNLPEFKNALYLRIDVIKNGDEWQVMEVELFEPQLFFYLIADKTAQKKALRRFVNGAVR